MLTGLGGGVWGWLWLMHRAEAGGCPAATYFSFASPKESNPRKGDPGACVPSACATGQPAVLGPGGVWLNSPSAQTTPALIRLALCSSAHSQGVGIQRQIPTRQGHAAACPCLYWFPLPLAPCGWAEQRRWRRGQGRSYLSAASSADPRRSRAAQVARSASAGTQTSGRLSFGYFSLAKQEKVSRPPGRVPASGLNNKPETHRTPANNAAFPPAAVVFTVTVCSAQKRYR